jgi:hypothetical protein
VGIEFEKRRYVCYNCFDNVKLFLLPVDAELAGGMFQLAYRKAKQAFL